VEGLRRCGRNLTVENFVAAMDSFGNFQGIGAKISFGPERRQGTRSLFLGKCLEGGKIQRISDWMTSDIDLSKALKRLGR